MAAAFFNAAADPQKARAISAGTQPGLRVHPIVVDAMREAGIDLGSARPQPFTTEIATDVRWLITMGCGESCPFVPGAHVEDWPIADPAGQPIERVRAIRDEVYARVARFIEREQL